MATIYQKTPTDNCLVLESREGLYYPFNVGNYQEVRFGAYFSVTSSTGFNTQYGGDENPSDTRYSDIYLGFAKTGQNFQLGVPVDTGLIFCGVNNILGVPSAIRTTGASTNIFFEDYYNNLSVLVTDYDGIYFSDQIITGGGAGIYLSNPTGNSGYANFFGMSLTLISNTFSLSISNNQTPAIAVDEISLRQDLASFNNPQLAGTGFFTTGYGNTFDLIDTPDSIFMYFPFVGSRIRIHAIAVERFS